MPYSSRLRPWILASRPKTLFAALAPVLAGSAVALHDGGFRPAPALAALLGAVFIQIGANFANDVADFRRGADTTERLGPLRVTQAGLLTPDQVTLGMWISFGLASLMGIYLLFTAGWPVILIGLASILAGISYTGGPVPFGYYGLGDLMVFLFFGPVAVMGTYYVQALQIEMTVVWASIPIGLLATAILVVNNLRDINTDKKSGKRTLAVWMGEAWTQHEYAILLALSYLVILFSWITGSFSFGALMTYLSLPLTLKLIRQVYRQSGKALNPILAQTGQLELAFAILFSTGILLFPI